MNPSSGQRKLDSCYSWVVCICGTLASAVTIGLMFSFGVLYPVLLDHFKESKDKTGIARIHMQLCPSISVFAAKSKIIKFKSQKTGEIFN